MGMDPSARFVLIACEHGKKPYKKTEPRLNLLKYRKEGEDDMKHCLGSNYRRSEHFLRDPSSFSSSFKYFEY